MEMVTPYVTQEQFDRVFPDTLLVETNAGKLLLCPECDSENVAVTAEQMFMVNTDDHYCHSVKTQDSDAKATCLDCGRVGRRDQLKEKS